MAKKGKRRAKGRGTGSGGGKGSGAGAGRYLSPGVYLEEVESGARPIEGVGTSIGCASSGSRARSPRCHGRDTAGGRVAVVVVLAAGAALAVRAWRQVQA